MATDLKNFDVAVIGAGCIGSACARHLSQLCDDSICLIGPDEPDRPRSEDTNRNVYGAHYDAGRITRILDPDFVWAKLAQRSIPRYQEVEKKSGTQFYTESGFLAVAEAGATYIERVKECAKILQADYQFLDHQQLQNKFPYFTFPSTCVGIYQPKQSGHINIRQHVIAQKIVAQKQGCQIIKEVVDSVTPDQNGKFTVTTENGNRIYSKKVVLATGAFTPFKKLLPDHHKQLDLTLMKESVLKVEVKQEDLHKLKTMPSVIYFTGKDARYDCYILPPICYDDNKYYIKIGHGASDSGKLINHQEVMQWYRDTDSDSVAPKLMKTLYNLMPGLKYTSGVVDHCVSTHTPSNHVMIDEISKGLTLLIGGCAHAAKSADEIGYLGALTTLNDSWSYDIPKHEFTVYFKSSI